MFYFTFNVLFLTLFNLFFSPMQVPLSDAWLNTRMPKTNTSFSFFQYLFLFLALISFAINKPPKNIYLKQKISKMVRHGYGLPQAPVTKHIML